MPMSADTKSSRQENRSACACRQLGDRLRPRLLTSSTVPSGSNDATVVWLHATRTKARGTPAAAADAAAAAANVPNVVAGSARPRGPTCEYAASTSHSCGPCGINVIVPGGADVERRRKHGSSSTAAQRGTHGAGGGAPARRALMASSAAWKPSRPSVHVATPPAAHAPRHVSQPDATHSSRSAPRS
eukprot:365255-Chlamydomonas_euryale.AAC.3